MSSVPWLLGRTCRSVVLALGPVSAAYPTLLCLKLSLWLILRQTLIVFFHLSAIIIGIIAKYFFTAVRLVTLEFRRCVRHLNSGDIIQTLYLFDRPSVLLRLNLSKIIILVPSIKNSPVILAFPSMFNGSSQCISCSPMQFLPRLKTRVHPSWSNEYFPSWLTQLSEAALNFFNELWSWPNCVSTIPSDHFFSDVSQALLALNGFRRLTWFPPVRRYLDRKFCLLVPWCGRSLLCYCYQGLLCTFEISGLHPRYLSSVLCLEEFHFEACLQFGDLFLLNMEVVISTRSSSWGLSRWEVAASQSRLPGFPELYSAYRGCCCCTYQWLLRITFGAGWASGNLSKIISLSSLAIALNIHSGGTVWYTIIPWDFVCPSCSPKSCASSNLIQNTAPWSCLHLLQWWNFLGTVKSRWNDYCLSSGPNGLSGEQNTVCFPSLECFPPATSACSKIDFTLKEHPFMMYNFIPSFRQ